MAVVVGYYEGTEETPIDRARAYAEGPFVIVEAGGWRVEVDSGDKGVCPVLPDSTIYKMRASLGLGTYKSQYKEAAAKLCDVLNQKVRDGEIVWKPTIYGGFWYAPAFEGK